MKQPVKMGLAAVAVVTTLSACQPQTAEAPATEATDSTETTAMTTIEVTYPTTAKGDVVDTYFGVEVADPYRWLEDDRSAETEEWVKTQNQTTYGYLDNIPYRQELKERLEKLWNYEKVGSPFKEGDYTYFYKNDGLQNQYVIYRKKEDVV